MSNPQPTRNRQWLINGHPRRRPIEPSDFKETVSDLEPLEVGQLRVKTEYLSFDPSQKGQMENVGGYAAPTKIGDVMRAHGIGRVIASTDTGVAEGTLVSGPLGWQEYATLRGRDVEVLPDEEHPSIYLGPLGGTGLSAYFGLFRVGRPEPGDTLVVSGAAGAVGSMAGQLGRIAGCRTIGIAGGAEKCRWLVDEVGYDAAIDYKSEAVRARLKELCPAGINVYFDNVGGDALNEALARIARHARVVICGAISRYEREELPPGPANYFNLVFARATMQGFLLNDYTAEFATARARIRAWIEAGEIVYKEDVQHGFDNIPATLMRLFKGQNFGKQLLRLD